MTNSTNSAVIGRLDAVDGAGVVRVQSRYDTDAADLWTALTDPHRLSRWIAEVSGELRLGGTFDARFTSGWTGPGRVDACEPPQRLRLTMGPGQDDETVIEAWLSADGDGTRLVVEERGLPLAQVHAHGAGWQAHLEDLAAALAGRPRADWHERWTELLPGYAIQAEPLR